MKVLMIGDIVGKPGRDTVSVVLPHLRNELDISFVVANGENAAGGFGLTKETAENLLASGVDVITSGNHIWDKKDIIPYMNGPLPILRPNNYPSDNPGRGHVNINGILVINLIGRVFVGNYDCPFRSIDQLLTESTGRFKAILVDLHAEATSEKIAMGWYLDGRVSAIVGTHTHVPTADARILPKGTGYVTDLGMVGSSNSVIGSKVGQVLDRFLTQTPQRLQIATDPPMNFNSVLIDIDDTGRATKIMRIDKELN